MKHPTIEVSQDFLNNSTLVTMHAEGMMTANELRLAMDQTIRNMFGIPATPWWEEPVV